MKALILAAGFGSRLMPLTKDRPKCMVEYKGKKIIDYEIEALLQNSLEISIVCGYLSEVLQNYLKDFNKIKHFFYNKNYDKTNMVQTLFCAKDLMLECIKNGEDLIVSYADIVYFEDTIEKLKNNKSDFAIVVDKSWQKLWEQRFDNILDDAESLKINNGFITELGKKASSLNDIDAQYIGLFKFSSEFLKIVLKTFDGLDKRANYDGKDFYNMYMTSFLQILINKGHKAKAVLINGNWCECDSIDDLNTKIIKGDL